MYINICAEKENSDVDKPLCLKFVFHGMAHNRFSRFGRTRFFFLIWVDVFIENKTVNV